MRRIPDVDDVYCNEQEAIARLSADSLRGMANRAAPKKFKKQPLLMPGFAEVDTTLETVISLDSSDATSEMEIAEADTSQSLTGIILIICL